MRQKCLRTIKPGLAWSGPIGLAWPQSWPQKNFGLASKIWPALKFGLLNNVWPQFFFVQTGKFLFNSDWFS